MPSITAYLSFDGRCEEAFEFYVKALHARVESLQRFEDAPAEVAAQIAPAGAGKKIMHGTLRIGSTVLMASDGECGGCPEFKGVQLSLNAISDAEAAQLFNALSDGGSIEMPLQKTFWTSGFGMLTDRFGVPWMVNVGPDEQAV